MLLFPDGSQTPFKEFKTACYTTTDTQSTGGFVAAGEHNVVIQPGSRIQYADTT